MSTEAGASSRRLSLSATIIAAIAVLVLLGLGTWQLQRLAWKQNLIERIEAGLAAAPVELPQRSGLDAFDYRRVRIEGHFVHDQELYLTPRMLNGRAGGHVLTPLVRADGTVVLVDRGWVPEDRVAPATRGEGQRAGRVAIEGIARHARRPNAFTPENDVAGNRWYWIDLPAMAAHLDLDLLPILVEAGPEPNLGGLPVGGRSQLDIRNDHLGYAITWYALAAALAVVYFLYRRGARRAT